MFLFGNRRFSVGQVNFPSYFIFFTLWFPSIPDTYWPLMRRTKLEISFTTFDLPFWLIRFTDGKPFIDLLILALLILRLFCLFSSLVKILFASLCLVAALRHFMAHWLYLISPPFMEKELNLSCLVSRNLASILN